MSARIILAVVFNVVMVGVLLFAVWIGVEEGPLSGVIGVQEGPLISMA